MTEPCIFPDCPEPTNPRNDGTHACTTHARVHVATTGSWLEDEHHHHLEGGRA